MWTRHHIFIHYCHDCEMSTRLQFTSHKYFHHNYLSTWNKIIKSSQQEQAEQKKVFEEGLCSVLLQKTRIKGTRGEINDIVAEVLPVSQHMIFELYRWIVIRYFSWAAPDAHHLVPDDSVTDREAGGGGGGGGGGEGGPFSCWKARRLYVAQSLNLHIVM